MQKWPIPVHVCLSSAWHSPWSAVFPAVRRCRSRYYCHFYSGYIRLWRIHTGELSEKSWYRRLQFLLPARIWQSVRYGAAEVRTPPANRFQLHHHWSFSSHPSFLRPLSYFISEDFSLHFYKEHILHIPRRIFGVAVQRIFLREVLFRMGYVHPLRYNLSDVLSIICPCIFWFQSLNLR